MILSKRKGSQSPLLYRGEDTHGSKWISTSISITMYVTILRFFFEIISSKLLETNFLL